MARNIGAGISHADIVHEDSQYPFYVAGSLTRADEGKAVALDATASYRVKLAGDNDPVLGKLAIYEDRVNEGIKVGTVSTEGGFNLPKGANTVINVGEYVVGAGSGLIKKADVANNPTHKKFLVVDIPATTAVTVISV